MGMLWIHHSGTLCTNASNSLSTPLLTDTHFWVSFHGYIIIYHWSVLRSNWSEQKKIQAVKDHIVNEDGN